jgi:basic membrane lipoprotein Med (substrate-binding protein (PBP1-ABC) superfamily)
MKKSLFVVIFAAVLPAVAQQSPETSARAEVLVLGVYHMSNPGHDIFNTKVDDVLAPKRQAEIAQVTATLAKFHPTKIAVERTVGDDRITKAYADYLAGKHELTSNEIEQLGFRLAKELGHKTVYAVDVDGEFPFQHIINYAKASGRSKELDALLGEIGAKVKAENAYLASHTVLETLLYMNADDEIAEYVGFYYREAQFGEPWDWAGADLLAEWYRRNIRIYSNIMQLVDSPNERVLVIYGAGHTGWLQHNFASNPKIRLRKLTELAR